MCIDSLNNDQSNHQIVPLAIKNIEGQQKFRIPFKNMGTQEIEVEFLF